MHVSDKEILAYLDEAHRRQDWEEVAIAERALSGIVSVAVLLRLDPNVCTMGRGPVTPACRRAMNMERTAARRHVQERRSRAQTEVEIDVQDMEGATSERALDELVLAQLCEQTQETGRRSR